MSAVSRVTSALHRSAVPSNGASLEAERSTALPPTLRECVARAVRRYLADVESEPDEGLHALVVREVERPLLSETLAWYGGNQSRAAAALGISRATFRKKLLQYHLAR